LKTLLFSSPSPPAERGAQGVRSNLLFERGIKGMSPKNQLNANNAIKNNKKLKAGN
jgi:hypothetical protein